MKKFYSIICTLLIISVAFCACSKTVNVTELRTDTTTSTTKSTLLSTDELTTKSSGKSTTRPAKGVFYDRRGKVYKGLDNLPYFTRQGAIYHYSTEKKCFVSTETGEEYDISKCFIDAGGYFFYDEEGVVKLEETALTALDANGNTCYPASTIRWTADNEIVLAFGLGKTVQQLTDEQLKELENK